MDTEVAVHLAREALVTVLIVGGPVLVLTTAVGLVVSVFQAVTQINEQSLTFVPKILAVAVTLALLGPWMLTRLVGYAADVFTGAAQLAP